MMGKGAGFGRIAGALARSAAVCALLCAAPAGARPGKRAVRPLPSLPAFAAFTPAAADPRLAAAFARSGLGSENFGGGAFRFTPAGGGGSRRAVTVAVRARAARGTAADRAITASPDIMPSAYSLGMSVGWKRFAISGDIARADGGLMPEGRVSADLGLSFSGRRWATKIDLAADKASGDRPPMLGIDQSWSVGLGGSYALTHNLNVSGGVRYKTQEFDAAQDLRRDSQAVYLGTTFRF